MSPYGPDVPWQEGWKKTSLFNLHDILVKCPIIETILTLEKQDLQQIPLPMDVWISN